MVQKIDTHLPAPVEPSSFRSSIGRLAGRALSTLSNHPWLVSATVISLVTPAALAFVKEGAYFTIQCCEWGGRIGTRGGCQALSLPWTPELQEKVISPLWSDLEGEGGSSADKTMCDAFYKLMDAAPAFSNVTLSSGTPLLPSAVSLVGAVALGILLG